MELTDAELAAAVKACDIHRQSLMKRVAKMSAGSVKSELLVELDATRAAADAFKDEQRRRTSVAA